MNKPATVLAICLSASVAIADAVVPTVSNVHLEQKRSRAVVITYTLANGPAVVTFDIQTNCVVNGETQWASIGGRNIDNYSGDGNCLVTGDTTHRIEWHPDKSWPDHVVPAGGARAVLTAWAPDSTPDYMVVDLAEQSNARVRYYASTNDLPGGLLDNEAYRTTLLVMRRIHAKNVSWTMGSYFEEGRVASTEMTHQVMLTNDYYMGVFEITQGQWAMVKGTAVSAQLTNPYKRLLRPMENISTAMMRESGSNTQNSEAWYPNPPNGDSFLGVLRARTQLDFDLPSEAQWEFAARAGHGENKWGDGSPYKRLNGTYSAEYLVPGRWERNQASPGTYSGGTSEATPENCTAICGSYPPNSFGLYDMHGNVYEMCLDWYKADITALGGAVNVSDGGYGSGTYASKRLIVRKGGNWGQGDTAMLRAADRQNEPSTVRCPYDGFRVMCRAGLK